MIYLNRIESNKFMIDSCAFEAITSLSKEYSTRLITKTPLQVKAGKAAGCRGHRMTEREEDEELLFDHNNDKANVISREPCVHPRSVS